MKLAKIARLAMTIGVVTVLGAAAKSPSSGTAVAKSNHATTASLSVVMGYVPDVEDYGFEYALHQGLYQAQGLSVKLIPGGQGIDQVQEVEAGVAQVGVGNAEQILAAVAKGAQVKVFGAEFQKSPVAMTCRKDSGVKSPADIKGKKVGVKPTAGPLLSLFLHKNDVSPGAIQQVPIGASDISEIVAGKVQCEFTTFAFNEPKEIADQGVPVRVFPLANYGLPAQEDDFFVNKSFYDNPANRETLVRFLKASAKGWATMFRNPDAAASYEVGHAFVDGLDLSQQKFQAEQQVIYMKSPLTTKTGLFALNPSVWVQTAKNLRAENVTPTVVDTAPLLTNSLIQRAGTPKL